jgi:hypothetical protein
MPGAASLDGSYLEFVSKVPRYLMLQLYLGVREYHCPEQRVDQRYELQ